MSKFVNISGSRINLDKVRLYELLEGSDQNIVVFYFDRAPKQPLSFTFTGPFKDGAKALLTFLDRKSIGEIYPFGFSYRIIPERNQAKFKELQEQLSKYKASNGPCKQLLIEDLSRELEGLYESWANK